MTKGVDERFEECVLRWLGHIERMGNDMIANRVCIIGYVGCSCRLVGLQRKSFIDLVSDCLKRSGNVGRAWRRVYDMGL